ncbi:putative phosphatidylinositol (3,5) kinase [Trypanosoma conorhini]|uniref:Putative phosphatidylinositol (3,5) kinase n=1 Tax=Trypanosoma conorhini TaxID=83891 RepID=A0A3R7P4L1_9TRYP|nr:putative phosphatidylinositol (3,5) kinase [Trypanosoma conorhini]RNF17296.1 putative phosphatidylinositol (3,5) kinase [Trypanosoma conorhini]
MQFVAAAPRAGDRLETLSMNVGVAFPHDLLGLNEKYDELLVDSIIVNTVFLEYVVGGFPGEEGGGGGGAADPNYSVSQSREVLPFYQEGDEALLDFLTERAKEGNSVRLIVHGNKRIWVKTSTDFNNAHLRRTDFAQSGSSFPPALADSLASSRSTGKAGDEAYVLLVQGYVLCKNCFYGTGNGSAGPPLAACSLPTLNLSWGAFLELLIYGSACFSLGCGHDPSRGVCISFLVFPRTRGEVTVTIVVEPLTVYDIVTPPATMPACADAVELYLTTEKEELLRCVGSMAAAVRAMTAAQAQLQQQQQQQQKPPSPPPQPLQLPQTKTLKPPFASLLHGRGLVQGDAAEFDAEMGTVLLRRAEELLRLIPSLQRGEDLTLLRLSELADLMADFTEWYKHGMLLAERRSGRPPPLVELAAFEDHSWAYCPQDNSGLRLNEPSSLVALALQASSLSPGGRRECLLGPAGSDPLPLAPPASKQGATSEQEAVMADSADGDASLAEMEEEATQVFLEDSMAVMLGIEPSPSPGLQPSSVFIRSAADALELLANRGPASKTAFKHAMDVILPWDKAGATTVTVEVMFPEQFAALQYLYTGGRTEEMMFSLSRTRAFKPQGGKTKSDFFITLDQRFLMKQLKQAELKHFAEFGPHYFSHMAHMYGRLERRGEHDADAVAAAPPGSVLSKIFGVFSIHVKRTRRFLETPAEVRYYALMENVFFARRADVMYDLKGSQRNRTAVEGSSVLLDQDLVGTLQKGVFFYCTNDAKSLLMDSLTSDVQLLAAASIMDYSLVAALSEADRQLSLGVIDYLHPYTGAKVLESKVKAGIDTVLGHAGRDPTIIDPASYRMRFTRRLGGYFCGVPDKGFAARRAMAKDNRRSTY